MAQATGHFIVEKDDATTAGREQVPAREQEFISVTLPGKVYFRPIFAPLGKDGALVEQLELPEWSLGFIAVADAAAAAHDITVNALLKLGGLGSPTVITPIEQRKLTGAAVKWNFLPIWWGHDTFPPLTFKSDVEVVIGGAGTIRVVSRIIPRSHLRGF